MSRNKKSFLLHIDSLDILDDLSDEQAGQLFKAIRAHQKHEEIEMSAIVRIAFSPFKNQFSRDNDRYELTCKRRADAGSKGGKAKASNARQGVANASNCHQEVANVADNKNKNKNKNKSDKDITLGLNELDRLFEAWWQSGIRKQNKKKAKSIFIKILAKESDPSAFTNQLINDVFQRLQIDQMGFAEMHPTTYLNGERWNDELKQPRRSAGPTSAAEQVRQAISARQADQAGGGNESGSASRSPLGSPGRDVREPIGEGVRSDTPPLLGDVLDGDFWQTDS